MLTLQKSETSDKEGQARRVGRPGTFDGALGALKKAKVIEFLNRGRTLAYAAEKVGIDQSTLWREREKNEEFRKACEEAKDSPEIRADAETLLALAARFAAEKADAGEIKKALKILSIKDAIDIASRLNRDKWGTKQTISHEISSIDSITNALRALESESAG